MLPLEGDVFQNGMEYIEKMDVSRKWKERSVPESICSFGVGMMIPYHSFLYDPRAGSSKDARKEK